MPNGPARFVFDRSDEVLLDLDVGADELTFGRDLGIVALTPEKSPVA